MSPLARRRGSVIVGDRGTTRQGATMSLGDVLLVGGGLVAFAGYFWALAVAFQDGAVRGIACLLVPLLLFYFLTMEPRRTWRPLLTIAGGLAASVYGAVLLKG